MKKHKIISLICIGLFLIFVGAVWGVDYNIGEEGKNYNGTWHGWKLNDYWQGDYYSKRMIKRSGYKVDFGESKYTAIYPRPSWHNGRRQRGWRLRE